MIARLPIMVRKDLLRRRRAPLAIFLVLAFPVVFSGLLALTFGGGATTLPRAVMLVEDRDQSFLSGLLVSAFGSEQLAQLVEARPVGEEGGELIGEGEASALLRIPAGFGERLLGGELVTLELVRNPAQGILPEIVEQVLAVFADGLDAGSRLLRGPLDDLQPLLDGGDSPSEAQVATIAVAFHRAIEGSSTFLLPPAIQLESVDLGEPAEDEPAPGFSVFLLILPGVSVWALFMVGDIAMRDILTETREGTLRRQLAGPLTSRDIVNGKAAFAALLALVSLLILSAIGAVALDRPVNVLAFVVLSAALILAATGFAAAVYGFARTENQGATFSSIVLLVFAFMGGSFVQVGSLPGAVQRFAPFSPFYWGVTGYGELIGNGAGVGDVLTNVLVLSSLGAALLALGAYLLDRKIRQGLAA